jgi:hypothetical protein
MAGGWGRAEYAERRARASSTVGVASRPAPAALADQYYYHFVLDGFQQLCQRSKVSRCLLDAAVFVNADGGG